MCHVGSLDAPLAKASASLWPQPQRGEWGRPMIARISIAVVAVMYGSNYSCVKMMDSWVGTPAEAAALRFSVAALVALPTLAHLARTSPHLLSWTVARDGVAIGMLTGAGYTVQAIALQTSSASVQAFIYSLSAIVVPLLEFFFGHSRQSARVWIAACVALAGVGCVEGPRLASARPAAGDGIGLLQPLFFGSAYWVCGGAISRHRVAEPGLALPIGLTAWSLLAVFAFAAMWLVVETMRSSASSDGSPPDRLWRLLSTLATSPAEHMALLGALIWTSLVTTACCSFAEAGALAEISAAEASIIFSTEPLWAALCARQMLGEMLGVHTVLGASLVAAACVISASDPAAEEAYRRVTAAADNAWATHCSGLRGKRPAKGTGLDAARGERERLLGEETETA
eukprot:scaffold16523_cov117-Isochrysis_galbana.AAC.4